MWWCPSLRARRRARWPSMRAAAVGADLGDDPLRPHRDRRPRCAPQTTRSAGRHPRGRRARVATVRRARHRTASPRLGSSTAASRRRGEARRDRPRRGRALPSSQRNPSRSASSSTPQALITNRSVSHSPWLAGRQPADLRRNSGELGLVQGCLPVHDGDRSTGFALLLSPGRSGDATLDRRAMTDPVRRKHPSVGDALFSRVQGGRFAGSGRSGRSSCSCPRLRALLWRTRSWRVQSPKLTSK